MKQSFTEAYGPWALVTGGASGIGAEFGRRLAELGLDLILVDRQGEMLADHARRLASEYGVAVRPVTVDLADPSFMDILLPAAADCDVGLLINNAGWGAVGPFIDTPLDDLLRAVDVNCRAPLVLARHFAPVMAARGCGGIIFVSSTSAFLGTPLVANYAATKAFNLVLAEGLWDELRGRGVDVLALTPGPTDTPAFRSVGSRIEAVPGMPFMTVEPVVAEALAALGRRPLAIPGRKNRIITAIMTRLLSRRRAVALTGKNTRLLYPPGR